MTLITENEELAAFCDRQKDAGFITVDTEFLRDRTYWPQLCLVQIAGPEEAAAIDPLAPGIDLTPLFDLMRNPDLLKVFHAARQDIEIFYQQAGAVPSPIFDSQVAAMVCGFGESVGYETLVLKLAGERIDKSSRFTDWSHRPLTDKQLSYALSDVTHLRVIYSRLAERLESTGRAAWLQEEMSVLTAEDTYRLDPDEAWKRLKTRKASRRFMAILKELAAWREKLAQHKNVPRARILRDETIMDLAAQAPTTVTAMSRARSMSKGTAEGKVGAEILEAIQRGLHMKDADIPEPFNRAELPPGTAPLMELLKVLLKMRCEDHDVAQKLVAHQSDLEEIAVHGEQANTQALKGWRREIFGEDALNLMSGKIALTASGTHVSLIRFEGDVPVVDKIRPRRRSLASARGGRRNPGKKRATTANEGAAFAPDGAAAHSADD